ncbi:hypothetical protein ACJJTC_015443 [Scirpophaga incertulas]
MDESQPSISKNFSYIEKKREELKIFFKDAKFSQDVIDKIIENELNPLTSYQNRPYIVASDSNELKSEYEVMTGQPFTEIENCNRPLTESEVTEKIKANPIIIEKAKQIQIIAGMEGNSYIPISFDQINLPSYNDMRAEIDAAEGDVEKLNQISYKNMQSLMTSIAGINNGSDQTKTVTEVISEKDHDTEDETNVDKELDAIEKVVSQYTDKTYETRFIETRDMLSKLADKHDNIQQPNDNLEEYIPNTNPILRESSELIAPSHGRKSVFEEIKESYAINEALNISLKDNPVTPQLSGVITADPITNIKYEIQNETPINKSFPSDVELKLQATEKALLDVTSVFSLYEENKGSIDEPENPLEHTQTEDIENQNFGAVQQVDEQVEQTLQSTLGEIIKLKSNEKHSNNEMELEEKKKIAHNIVEGAENLSSFIRADITNKLNSMNELLSDVNTALENSRKSNIVYQQLHCEQENNDDVKLNITEYENEVEEMADSENNEKPVTDTQIRHDDTQIRDIQDSIRKLNTELKCHEERINQSMVNYEKRNKECKIFIREVDDILQKSHNILHPVKESSNDLKSICLDDSVQVTDLPTTKKLEPSDDFGNKKMSEYTERELDRSKRIQNLLYDIKDKMKDNKDVQRIANNMLRGEENRKKAPNSLQNCKITEITDTEIDTKAQGDYISDDSKQQTSLEESVKEQSCSKEIEKVEVDQELQRRKEFQLKIDKETEELKKGPRMTKDFIKKHCREHKLYSTPYLNDILYLHFKGFTKIENLDEYTGLKCIFLENNGIQRIEGLDALSQLKCLYLHYNIVKKIENLQGCPKLDTLNLDHNFVTKIENLDVVPDLHTLSIAHNMLTTFDDLAHLKMCRSLSVLDLSYNRLEDPLIVDVLADMILLKVLVLTGNPVVRNIPAYRKTLTLRLKGLLNLDNRPVFPRDRACAEAWQRGGLQEEIAERKRWIAKDQEKTMQSVRYLINMRDKNKALREAREQEARLKLESEQEQSKNQEKTNDESVDKELSLKEDEGPSSLEEKYGPTEVKTIGGIAEDMLTGSEAEDSTSEDLDSEDSDSKDVKDTVNTEPSTSKIEWSELDRGKRLIQEIKEENPITAQPGDYWTGFRGDLMPPDANKFCSDFQSLNDLLFNQPTHKEVAGIRKSMKLEPDKNVNESKDIKSKPIIEVIQPETDEIVDEKTINKDFSLIEVLNTPLNEGKKLSNDDYDSAEDNEISMNKTIMECTNEISNPIKNDNPIEDERIKPENNDDKGLEDSGSLDTVQAVQHRTIGGEPVINDDDSANDEDMQPSAEDLEIFAEIERDQEIREIRIQRGEQPVDPMKLYDKATMDSFHKAADPTPAHEIRKTSTSTMYKHDNVFDRVALSQLTGGAGEDGSQFKLTHTPGAVVVNYEDSQKPINEVQYEIGEEKIDSENSSGETDIIDISSDISAASDEEVSNAKSNIKSRPETANIKNSSKTDSNSTKEHYDINLCESNKTIEIKPIETECLKKSNEATREQLSGSLKVEQEKNILSCNECEGNFKIEIIREDSQEEEKEEDHLEESNESFEIIAERTESPIYENPTASTSGTYRNMPPLMPSLRSEYSKEQVKRIFEMNSEPEEIDVGGPGQPDTDSDDDTLVGSQNDSLETTLTEERTRTKAEAKSFDTDELTQDAANEDNDITDDSNDTNENCVTTNENYTLEMKLALGLDQKP